MNFIAFSQCNVATNCAAQVLTNATRSFFLTDTGTEFLRKVFAAICGYAEVKHMKIIAYHAHTNGQVKMHTKEIVARLPHCVAKQHNIQNIFVRLLSWASRTHVHRSVGRSPVQSRFSTIPVWSSKARLPAGYKMRLIWQCMKFWICLMLQPIPQANCVGAFCKNWFSRKKSLIID